MMGNLDSDTADNAADDTANNTAASTTTDREITARLLMRDLAPIGDVTLEPRLGGFALLEDGVMFAYVDADGTPYLRTTLQIAQQFHALGSRKHSDMRYWTIPNSITADLGRLRAVASEAAGTESRASKIAKPVA